MSQLDAVEVMGLLLRDRELRIRFANAPSAVVRELGLVPSQASFVCALDLRQLSVQAESLIRKRQSEVARLVPKTWLRLGREAGVQFHQYADQSPWPEGHRRHLLDASLFCRFLREKTASEYLRSEHHWVAFLASDRLFSVQLCDDLIVFGKARWAVQFCVRRNGVPTSRALYFGSLRARN